VHVGFRHQLRKRSSAGARREDDSRAKGGLIELSLGILLSKGGMTVTGCPVSSTLWTAALGRPHRDSEE
jgi:hypothetical protein